MINRNKVYHRDRDLVQGRMAEKLAGGFERIQQLSRRQILKAGLAAAGGLALGAAGGLLSPSRALADEAVKTGKFIFPRLQFTVYDNTPDIWNVHLIGDAILRKKLQELTNVNVSTEPVVVRLGEFSEMVRNPFVFMTSEGYFKLPDDEEKNLREFLERGGFIYADDCVYGGGGDRFFTDYKKLIDRLFPDNPMRFVPKDDEIYGCYFKFDKGAPHMQGVQHGGFGLYEPGTSRIMTYLTPGDLHCGWTCRYWKEEQNLEAIKMGINIIIYFLTH